MKSMISLSLMIMLACDRIFRAASVNSRTLYGDEYDPRQLGINVPSNNICGWLQKRSSQCTIIASIEFALNSTGTSLLTCSSQQELPGPVLKPFGDATPLPNAFPNPGQVFTDEGSSLYWLLRMIFNLNTFTSCQSTDPSLQYKVPDGWSVVKIIPLQQSPVSLPFVAILLNKSTKQLVIIIRGTMSSYEWGIDFTYNQTSVPVLDGVSFPSPMHAGFTTAYTALWQAGIQDALQKYVVQDKTATQVTIAGHSLGAAVAQLVGYATQTYLNNKMQKNAPLAATILSAPPNVGPPAFANAYNKLVNGRRIAFAEDVITQIPCAPEQKACKALLYGYPIPTNMPGNTGQWPYASVGGTLPFSPDNMPTDKVAWGRLDAIPLNTNAVPFLSATHVCSYLCYTSQFAETPVSNNQCWLTEQPANAPGSQCRNFPTKNNYPLN